MVAAEAEDTPVRPAAPRRARVTAMRLTFILLLPLWDVSVHPRCAQPGLCPCSRAFVRPWIRLETCSGRGGQAPGRPATQQTDDPSDMRPGGGQMSGQAPAGIS